MEVFSCEQGETLVVVDEGILALLPFMFVGFPDGFEVVAV